MTLWRVTFTRLMPVSRSVFVEDELDEMNDDDITSDGWFALRSYLEANREETADWEDPEIEVVQ